MDLKTRAAVYGLLPLGLLLAGAGLSALRNLHQLRVAELRELDAAIAARRDQGAVVPAAPVLDEAALAGLS